MVEIGIRVNRVHRLAYLPKILIESLGSELTIKPDSRAAVIYPTGEDPEVVMASLRIILQSMELSSKTPRRTGEDPR